MLRRVKGALNLVYKPITSVCGFVGLLLGKKPLGCGSISFRWWAVRFKFLFKVYVGLAAPRS
jgi:hypothetical protein